MAEVTRHGIYYSEANKCILLDPIIENPVDIRCPECGYAFTIDKQYIDKGERNTRAYCRNCECEFIPEESDIIEKQLSDEDMSLISHLKIIAYKMDKVIEGLNK